MNKIAKICAEFDKVCALAESTGEPVLLYLAQASFLVSQDAINSWGAGSFAACFYKEASPSILR